MLVQGHGHLFAPWTQFHFQQLKAVNTSGFITTCFLEYPFIGIWGTWVGRWVLCTGTSHSPSSSCTTLIPSIPSYMNTLGYWKWRDNWEHTYLQLVRTYLVGEAGSDSKGVCKWQWSQFCPCHYFTTSTCAYQHNMRQPPFPIINYSGVVFKGPRWHQAERCIPVKGHVHTGQGYASQVTEEGTCVFTDWESQQGKGYTFSIGAKVEFQGHIQRMYN